MRRLGASAAYAGQVRQLLEVLVGMGRIVRALGQRGEAQLVGQPRLRHQLLKADLHVVAGVKLAAGHQAELHLDHSSV